MGHCLPIWLKWDHCPELGTNAFSLEPCCTCSKDGTACLCVSTLYMNFFLTPQRPRLSVPGRDPSNAAGTWSSKGRPCPLKSSVFKGQSLLGSIPKVGSRGGGAASPSLPGRGAWSSGHLIETDAKVLPLPHSHPPSLPPSFHILSLHYTLFPSPASFGLDRAMEFQGFRGSPPCLLPSLPPSLLILSSYTTIPASFGLDRATEFQVCIAWTGSPQMPRSSVLSNQPAAIFLS